MHCRAKSSASNERSATEKKEADNESEHPGSHGRHQQTNTASLDASPITDHIAAGGAENEHLLRVEISVHRPRSEKRKEDSESTVQAALDPAMQCC